LIIVILFIRKDATEINQSLNTATVCVSCIKWQNESLK